MHLPVVNVFNSGPDFGVLTARVTGIYLLLQKSIQAVFD